MYPKVLPQLFSQQKKIGRTVAMHRIRMVEIVFEVWSGIFAFEACDRHCLVTYSTQLLEIMDKL